jgi:hypothetical protein
MDEAGVMFPGPDRWNDSRLRPIESINGSAVQSARVRSYRIEKRFSNLARTRTMFKKKSCANACFYGRVLKRHNVIYRETLTNYSNIK